MAMAVGGSQKAQINITPMIDVLLVLIIIFMVVVYNDAYGLDARVPQPPKEESAANPQDLVVFVGPGHSITLNREAVSEEDLSSRLAQVFKSRGNHVLFVGGAPELDFEEIVRVIDIARGAGLDRVALLPRESADH